MTLPTYERVTKRTYNQKKLPDHCNDPRTTYTDKDRLLVAGAQELSLTACALKTSLHTIASTLMQTQRERYPFLTSFGTETFDNRILTRVVASLEHRLQKLRTTGAYCLEVNANNVRQLNDQVIATVYNVHVPAYTKMFNELDKRNFRQEVFLGRDADHMYYARKAQLWGRGQSAKRIVRLNFPKTFTQLDNATIHTYLHDRGINNIRDVIFVDTGSTGTIPDRILRSCGVFKMSEQNKHMLLIHSNIPERSLPNFPEGINLSRKIEGAPKAANKAEGLYINQRNSKLTPYSRPLVPQEIFRHECIKFLCMRHFYLQGKDTSQRITEKAPRHFWSFLGKKE